MAHRDFSVSATANIESAATRVFAVISDPSRLVKLSPGTVLIGDVEECVTGGFQVRASSPSQLTGYQVRLMTELYDPPNRLIISSELVQRGLVAKLLRLRIADRVEWIVRPAGENRSAVTLTVTWQKLSVTSGPLMGRHARRTVEDQLRRLAQLAVDAR